MDIRNCRKCGSIFNYVLGPVLCPACREDLEKKFQEVKQYIQNNPGVNIQQVSEACEVEPSQIQKWLREERLEIVAGSSVLLNCESCGAPIRSGKYCDKCRIEMANGLHKVLRDAEKKPEEKTKDSGVKMRYL